VIDDILQRLLAATTPRQAIAAARPAQTHIAVYRSIPVVLHDGPTRSTFYTARQTIGQALAEQGLALFPADRVMPDLETPLSPGMHIYLERSRPATILADGQIVQTRTHEQTVGGVLAQEGFILAGQDYTIPALDRPIPADDTIQVIRVREALEIEEEFIPFETHWLPDENLELDRQQVRQEGITGVIKSRTRVRYENGQEVWREVEDEWLDQEPANRVVAYGTNIVVRTLETADGPVEYWRRIPMLTTAYNAASSGKALDHLHYGITRSGLPAGYGVVAVDPKVVPLRTKLYIPGYGIAIAGDTGGSILGKHIDLGFDDDVPLPFIYEWRDIYVLTPAPHPNRVRYVLPQWPQR
jgi:uncharacterized protein YabE (DUF348 family)